MRNKGKLYSTALALIAFILVFLISISCMASTVVAESADDQLTLVETQITNNPSWKEDPVIYGDRIVWVDYREGKIQICMYNFSTSNETQVITTSSRQEDPRIYGNRIIWVDNRNDDYDIYMYDLLTSKETQITTNKSDQYFPAIYEDKIVWTDDRNGNQDIYMYDLSNSKEIQITTNGSSQALPVIYGDKIVWQDQRNGNWDVYMYDLSNSKESQITTNKSDQHSPDVYKDRIFWEDERSGQIFNDIYMYNVSTSTETQIAASRSVKTYYDIYENRIVWQDERNVNQDIYMYDLSTSNETQITTNGSNQLKPAIYGNRIVWQDSRNGNYEIYMCTILEEEQEQKAVANFTSNVTAGYAPLDVQFTDLSQNETSRIWNFGDGTSSTDKNPTHTYSMVGKYVVNLTVKNTNGTVSKSSMINVLPIKHADGQFTFTETQITTNESFPDDPDIYGNIIVWDDWRNGDGDVYMYDTSTSIETQITANGSDQMEPTVYEDKIIWIDGRSQNLDNFSIWGNFDIWMYNLSTREETQVTTSESCKHHPRVFDDKIVWHDSRNNYNFDIYMYDLSTSIESQITNSGRAYNPCIYGDIIVWEDYRNASSLNGNSDIYMYNLSTSKETQITTNIEYQFRPTIYKDRIVWEDWRNDGRWNNSDIYMYDISTSKETQITANGSVQLSPAIYENKIVWDDRRNGQPDIYIYDFSDLKEARVSLSERAYSPVIYGDKIVWTDWRNQNHDIFMCTVEDNLQDTEENDISGTHGGSSGGSSGSDGGSPEPAKNVEVKELCQVFITNGNLIKFGFTQNATCIVSVRFDSKKTVGKTTTIVEQLKNKSTLTSNLTEGEVYKYFNIWVGNSGFASSENIGNPAICFKVEKSWMQNKSIDQDSITLNRYTNKTWEQMPATLTGEDSKYLYFTADVSGFSFFAITGKPCASPEEAVTEIQSDNSDNSENKENTGLDINTKQEEGKADMPGFGIIGGIVGLLGVFLYRRR